MLSKGIAPLCSAAHRNVVTCDEHGVVHVEGADEGLGGEPGHQAAGRGQPPQSEDNSIHCRSVKEIQRHFHIFGKGL